MDRREIIVFADGSAAGNPGPGGWGAIIVTPADEVVELGGSAAHTTNNRMELTAVIEALRYLRSLQGELLVFSDSTYVVQGISRWLHSWKRRGWTTTGGTEVLNRSLWETLDRLVSERGSPGLVRWRHVAGHVGIPANERADEIARSHAAGRRAALYRGPLDTYPAEIFPLPDTATTARPKSAAGRSGKGSGEGSRKKSGKTAYSYLSVVDGRPMRHGNWADCERRVKGRARALFKKAMSPEDEVEILRDWGFSPRDL